MSYGDPELEIDSEEVSSDEYSVSFTVYLTCGDCSTQLKSASLEGAVTIEHNCQANGDEQEDEDLEFTIESSEVEFYERAQAHDRHNKPIKRARYARQYYGGTVTATLQCQKCDEQFDVTVTEDDQASGFEELV